MMAKECYFVAIKRKPKSKKAFIVRKKKSKPSRIKLKWS